MSETLVGQGSARLAEHTTDIIEESNEQTETYQETLQRLHEYFSDTKFSYMSHHGTFSDIVSLCPAAEGMIMLGYESAIEMFSSFIISEEEYQQIMNPQPHEKKPEESNEDVKTLNQPQSERIDEVATEVSKPATEMRDDNRQEAAVEKASIMLDTDGSTESVLAEKNDATPLPAGTTHDTEPTGDSGMEPVMQPASVAATTESQVSKDSVGVELSGGDATVDSVQAENTMPTSLGHEQVQKEEAGSIILNDTAHEAEKPQTVATTALPDFVSDAEKVVPVVMNEPVETYDQESSGYLPQHQVNETTEEIVDDEVFHLPELPSVVEEDEPSESLSYIFETDAQQYSEPVAVTDPNEVDLAPTLTGVTLPNEGIGTSLEPAISENQSFEAPDSLDVLSPREVFESEAASVSNETSVEVPPAVTALMSDITGETLPEQMQHEYSPAAIQEYGTAATRAIHDLQQARNEQECRQHLEELQDNLEKLFAALGYQNADNLARQLIEKYRYDTKSLRQFIIALMKAATPLETAHQSARRARVPMHHHWFGQRVVERVVNTASVRPVVAAA